jgi:hypothetical protein
MHSANMKNELQEFGIQQKNIYVYLKDALFINSFLTIN